MSGTKLRIHNTELNNLVSNLRGEVGEIIFTWTLMRSVIEAANKLRTGTPDVDMKNGDLTVLDILSDKLRDEIVARLSELAEEKIGRLTFHFASVKLGKFEAEVRAFDRFIDRSRFREKRNQAISHKELPERWTEHKAIHISYRSVLRGIASALRFMKRIDSEILGPSAKYLWIAMRKRRYVPVGPAHAAYMLLPHLSLSKQDRASIIREEEAEGLDVWSDLKTTVNGAPGTVRVCKKWAAIALGDGRMMLLDEYPLIELKEISFTPSSDEPPGP